LGVALAMVGILLPSTTLTFTATRWAHQNRQRRTVRAFKQGMAPIGVGLVMATGWVLAKRHGDLGQDWPLWLVTLAATLMVWFTRVHLLWLLAAGALLGWFGWI
jgi:chromate transporter